MKIEQIPTRGIVKVRAAAPNPQAVFSELLDGIEKFKKQQTDRLGTVSAMVDEHASKIAALQVGGGGAHSDPAASRSGVRTNLGAFSKTGDPAALWGRAKDGTALAGGFRPQAAMSVDSDPDGGYTVPQELSSTIYSVQRDQSAMRRLARTIMTNSDSFEQPVNLGGMGSGWVGERQSRPETDGANLALVRIPAGEIYANPAITQKLLDDSAYNIGAFIEGELAVMFNQEEGDAFINGNGVNKPRGFLTLDITNEADAARAFGTLQYTPTGVATALNDSSNNGVDALIDLAFSLKAGYRANASWLMNSLTLSKVTKLKSLGDTQNYLWQPSMQAGQPDRLLGYPVAVDEDMPDIGANAYPIAFGDFMRGYLITDRTMIRLLRDPYTNKPYVMFYATKRVGGMVTDSNAIKLLKVAAN